MEDLALKILRANPSLCVVAASGYAMDTSAVEAALRARGCFAEAVRSGDAGGGGAEDACAQEENL